MNKKQYLLTFFLGSLAAVIIGKIVASSGAMTTVDAWFLTLNIQGHDVGDRMNILFSTLSRKYAFDVIAGAGYLIGQGFLEECAKFGAFILAFRFFRPVSIRHIICTGITVGLGFAVTETLFYYDTTLWFFISSIILRGLGHGLTSGFIALLFGLGYFSQMHWIDGGAKSGLVSWVIRYQERLVLIVLTIFGIFFSTALHATINIYAALGGQAIGIGIIFALWLILLTYLSRPESARQYGMLIREVDLLQKIATAKRDLAEMDTSSEIAESPLSKQIVTRRLGGKSTSKSKSKRKDSLIKN